MSAPEKIFVTVEYIGKTDTVVCGAFGTYPMDESVEFTRTDLSQAAANARADQARDAALVEALSACKQVAETAREYNIPQMVMGANKCHDDISDLRIQAHAILALRDKPAPAVTVQEAVKSIINNLSSTYTARNGRKMTIEGDDGEMCWILSNDGYDALRALAGQGE